MATLVMPPPASAPADLEPSSTTSGEIAWHALDIAEIERRLETAPSGLSHGAVRERLGRFGANEIKEEDPPSELGLLLDQLRSPLTAVLLVAGFVTIALREWVDAIVIAIVVCINAAIGFVQERHADRAVRALQQLLNPRARVIRDQTDWEIESRELVPGDVALLDSGSRIPADLRLVSTTALQVDESALTGESLPVTKRPATLLGETPASDRANIAFAGTVVVSGRGRGYVIRTGSKTALGSIARATQSINRDVTPVQRELNRFARMIGVAVAACSALTFAIGIASGDAASEMFLVAVALAVSAIPEGLPIAFTVTLSLGVRRMAQRRAIVRHLRSVEALGGTTVIGSDKTGTLTENRMTVRMLWVVDEETTLAEGWDGNQSEPLRGARAAASDSDPLYQLLLAGVLTNESRADRTADGVEIHGDPTEAALLVSAMRFGLEPTELQEQYPLIAELPFEPEQQFSLTIRCGSCGLTAYVKGAPERIVAMSATMLTTRGLRPIDPVAVTAAAQRMAERGLRVLAMAVHPKLDADSASDLAWMVSPRHLTFLGLQGMADPPRPGAQSSITQCRRAGIRVVMITGDHAETARSIATELGIATDGAPVLTGSDLSAMPAAMFEQHVADVEVFARVTPEQKLRIVRSLQQQGEIVTVTGDGVNDAPALRAADVGIAMGKRGTDVAKAAADVVLTDDNFVSIAAAVKEGRITVANIRKVIAYLFSSNVAEVLVILGALALDWPLPLIAAQILWLNLVTDSLQVLALAFEPGEPHAMSQPPRQHDAGILSRILWERTALCAVVMAVGTLAVFRWELDRTGSERIAQTAALTTMVLFQMFQAENARSETRSVFRMHPLSNPYLVLAMFASIVLQIAALYASVTQQLLRVEPLEMRTWALIMLVAATVIVASEVHKRIRGASLARK